MRSHDRRPETPSRAAPDGASRAIFAVRRARQAQRHWASMPVARRLVVIRRFRHRLAEHAEEVGRAVHLPGRDLAATLTAEVLPLLDACRFLEREAASILAPRRPLGRRPLWLGLPWLSGSDAVVRREPWGVVLILAPYNYPLLLAGAQAIQALTAGNAVVLKPGRGGAAAARRLGALLADSGLPADLLTVLDEAVEAGRGAIQGGVDKVILTGSATTGRAVLGDLAPRLVPATMELSGNDAVFIRSDADLELAARALRFGLELNGGATCIAPRRVFVTRERLDELERRLASLLDDVPPVDLDPELQARLGSLVDDAVHKGARVLCGEFSAEGVWPFVLSEVTAEMKAFSADVFAPLLMLVPVADDEEALELDRHCPYALGASVFGAPGRARRLAERIDAGVVVINDLIVPTADPRLPFGGRGESGYGSTRGAEGLLELTRPKAVVARSGRRRPHFEPPVSGAETMFVEFIRAVHAGSFGRRLLAFFRLFKIGRDLYGR